MHTITRIEKAKNEERRYHIFVDDRKVLSVHEDVLVKWGLHKGMTVRLEQLSEWARADEYAKVQRAVHRYLGYRARSTHEVRKYLERKGFDPVMCEEVIQECVEQGYLNDQAFAQAWVEERAIRKGLGKNRLRHELKQKGISSSDIENVLQNINEEEERQKAWELAERRYLRIQDQPWPTIERRIGQYLMRQGYSWNLIHSILNQLQRTMNEEL